MKLVNELCRQLGISHYDLSVLLGAPRTTITKAAAAERNLPVPYLLQISELQNLLKNLPAPTGAANEIDRDFFKRLQQEQEHKLMAVEREISDLRLQYRQSALLLQLIEKRQQQPLTSKQANWLELLKYKALKRQQNAGLHRITSLLALVQITEKAILVYSNLADH